MQNKQRVHAALEGKPVDRFPVAALYNFLVFDDRFSDLTGEPAWRRNIWKHGSPDEYIRYQTQMTDVLPFEIVQPAIPPARGWRERIEYVLKDGRPFRHDVIACTWEPIEETTKSGHAFDDTANQTQYVFNRDDVNERVQARSAETLVAEGVNDYIEATVSAYGDDAFVISGGVEGMVYKCHHHVGLSNLYVMMLEQPDLLDYLISKQLEQTVEHLRCLAAAGGDAIYIDDAMTTSDMISVGLYERFSLPAMTALVDEIHRLGHKAIVIYFGGVADRLDQIASIGADGVLVETSMKGYVNDIGDCVDRIGDQTTLFGNIDPVGVIQDGSDEDLEAEIRRQLDAGRQGRGFILSPASPLTPSTPLERIQRFIELGKEIGSVT